MRGCYRCNLCGYEVPADEIGVAVMSAHLDEKHADARRAGR